MTESSVLKESNCVQRPERFDTDNFHAAVGYRLLDVKEGEAVLELDLKAQHLNRGGVVHGGVLTALLDIICSEAGVFCPHPGRIRMAITLSLTVTFTGQCRAGTIRAVGKRRAGGRRIFNSTGEVFDEEGRLLAIAEGTFRLRSGSESLQGVPLEEVNA